MGGQKFQYNRKFRLYLATAEPEDKISKTLLSYTPVVQFTLNPSLVQELLQTALLAIVSVKLYLIILMTKFDLILKLESLSSYICNILKLYLFHFNRAFIAVPYQSPNCFLSMFIS